MEKRVFLAILLSFGVLAAYQAFFAPPPAPVTPPAAASVVTPGITTPGQTLSTPATVAPGATPGAAPVEASHPTASPLVADDAAHDIVVETDSIRAVFTSAGATLKSWTLKRYPEGGAPLEFVPRDLPPGTPRPFTLATNDAGLSTTLATALFKPSAGSLTLGSAPGQLSFQYSDQSGLNARKTFYFQPEGKAYVLKVEASVDVSGASRPVTLAWGPALGLGYTPDGSHVLPARVVQFRDGKVERLTASNLTKGSHFEGELRFAGVEDQYFLAAVLPGTEKIAVDYQPVTLVVPPPAAAGTNRTFISFSVSVPGSAALPFFMGPKDFDVLVGIDPKRELVRAIDFGIFSWLVVPLLQALKWIHSYVGNWGWAIIVLTIVINLLIFPLRHRSMVSMKKMQAIQPEMKAIQDRFAKYKLTDPERQKMNTEMMALYKQRGVNPASGCVPMLLTMPVLFAFYAMLSVAIELRGAPFLGWLHDLSRHDPFYITPIIMGGTMFLQQRLMPTTADPAQQKIFMLMPIIFTVSFLWAPSGLVLYWLMSNLLAIGQQTLTNRLIATPARVPARAVATRPKSAGNNGGAKS
jgi:YidC/Oxa1 family membrane protein insertase